MKKTRTQWKKEWAAALLLMVILFIHMVKVFHTHNSDITTHWQSETIKIEKADTCLICDYHLAKDTSYEIPLLNFIRPSKVVAYPILYTSRTITSTGLNYSDRGPPAIA